MTTSSTPYERSETVAGGRHPASQISHHDFRLAVAQRAGTATLDHAANVAHATLAVLAAWLPSEVAHGLARVLPAPLADSCQPQRSHRPASGDLVAFYFHVQAESNCCESLHRVSLHVAAVLAVLGETVPLETVTAVREALPADVAALIPEPQLRRR